MTFFLKEVTPFPPLQFCRTGSSEFSAKGLISNSVLEVYWEGEGEGRRRYLVGGQEEEEEQQKITSSAREGVGGQEINPGKPQITFSHVSEFSAQKISLKIRCPGLESSGGLRRRCQELLLLSVNETGG